LVGEFFRLRPRACNVGHSVLHFRLMCHSQKASGYWKTCWWRIRSGPSAGASAFRNESKKGGMEPTPQTSPNAPNCVPEMRELLGG
jgi:hypothetical protein